MERAPIQCKHCGHVYSISQGDVLVFECPVCGAEFGHMEDKDAVQAYKSLRRMEGEKHGHGKIL